MLLLVVVAAASAPGCEDPPVPAVCSGPAAALPTATFDGLTSDPARGRELRYRVRYAPGWNGCAPIVFLSHGGAGATDGQLALGHLGEEYAAHGFVAVHVNHLPSADVTAHEHDRPADVSFLLDQLVAGKLALPADLRAQLATARVGIAGHSWGAYTAHALGGATFDQGTFRDPRILAIVPISPQGPGDLGAFDRGPSDNTWRTVAVPAYTLVGSVEKDSSFGDDPPITAPDWRLRPFERYPTSPDRYLTIIAGQDHVAMGGGVTPAVDAFVALQSRTFFDAYVRGDAREVCAIGVTGAPPGSLAAHKSDPGGVRDGAHCP
ncbi:MAG: hypothetical protein JWP97_3916 [Labilithrix sp.]|nr:hypothetical protein [Labilithrix sp.]